MDKELLKFRYRNFISFCTGLLGLDKPAPVSKKLEEEFESLFKDFEYNPSICKRKITPTILQMEGTECGAASLAMVLAHNNYWVPLEQLRVDCGISRDGSKAINILKAARQHGLKAQGFRCEPRDLAKFPKPLIVHWGFNHFLIYEGAHRKKHYLNDPALGPRTVGFDEMDRSFTGICILMQKDKGFKANNKERPRVLTYLYQHIKANMRSFLFIFMMGFLGLVPGLLSPFLSQFFIDSLLIAQKESLVNLLVTSYCAVVIVQAMLSYLMQVNLLRLNFKLALGTTTKFFWHVLRLPETFFSQRHAGDITARVQSNEAIAGIVSGQLTGTAIQVMMVFVYGIIMFLFDWKMSAVIVFLIVLNFIFLKLVQRIREDAVQKMLKEGGQIQSVGIAGVRSIETIKASAIEDSFFERWSGHFGNLLNSQQRFGLMNSFIGLVPQVTQILITLNLLGIGGLNILNGSMTIGSLIAFRMISASFTGPLNALLALTGELQQMQGHVRRVMDVMKYEKDERYLGETKRIAEKLAAPAIVGKAKDKPIALPVGFGAGKKFSGNIEFKNVVYGYNLKEPPLFEGLSLSFSPGQRTAFVGSSGSGKSTLGRLMVGLLKPWSGDIYYDGIPVQDIPPEAFASSVAYVDQTISMFEGTVRENLLLWATDIPDFNPTRSLRDACLDDEVSQRPGGYDSIVKENAANYSGGQKQRLEIARTLARDPSILIFDEATSALDPVVEKQIDENIRRRGCTTFIIAHRLSTIRDADIIYLLKEGRIMQQGSHDELIKDKDGLYRAMVEAG